MIGRAVETRATSAQACRRLELSAIADASGAPRQPAIPHNARCARLNLPGEAARQPGLPFGQRLESFTLVRGANALEPIRGRVLSSRKMPRRQRDRRSSRACAPDVTRRHRTTRVRSGRLKMTVTPKLTAEGTVLLFTSSSRQLAGLRPHRGGIPRSVPARADKVLINAAGRPGSRHLPVNECQRVGCLVPKIRCRRRSSRRHDQPNRELRFHHAEDMKNCLRRADHACPNPRGGLVLLRCWR